MRDLKSIGTMRGSQGQFQLRTSLGLHFVTQFTRSHWLMGPHVHPPTRENHFFLTDSLNSIHNSIIKSNFLYIIILLAFLG